MNEKEKLVKENFNKNIDIHLKKLIRDNTVISNILPSEISNVIYLERFFNTEFTKTKDYSLNIFKQIEIDKHFKLDNIDWKYAILDYRSIINIYKRNNITQNLDQIISYRRPYREKYFILENVVPRIDSLNIPLYDIRGIFNGKGHLFILGSEFNILKGRLTSQEHKEISEKWAKKFHNIIDNKIYNDNKLNMKVSELGIFKSNNTNFIEYDFSLTESDLLSIFKKILEAKGFKYEKHYMNYNSLKNMKPDGQIGEYISIGDFRKIWDGEIEKKNLLEIIYNNRYKSYDQRTRITQLTRVENWKNVMQIPVNELNMKYILELLESKGFKREIHSMNYDSLKNMNLRGVNVSRLKNMTPKDAYVGMFISIGDFKKIYDGEILKANQLKKKSSWYSFSSKS